MLQDDNVNPNLDTSQDDIQLADYGLDFGLNPEAEQPKQQPVEPQQPVDDNWQVRASYFQSEYDKLRNKIDAYMPLIQTLESDEQATQRVIAALRGQPAEVQPPEPEFVLPERPLKPEGYNHEEAVTDPMSPSFKYRIAFEEYNERLGEYVSFRDKREKEESARAEQIAREYAARQQQSAKQEQFLGSTYNHLISQRNFTPNEAQEFIREMADDSAITLDNLIGYWRWNKGQQHQPRIPTKNVNNMPYPAIMGGGRTNTQSVSNPDAQFSQMLRNK